MKWIALKDIEPHSSEYVLFYSPTVGILLAEYDPYMMNFRFLHRRPSEINAEVTHWMPIPKPPTEE